MCGGVGYSVLAAAKKALHCSDFVQCSLQALGSLYFAHKSLADVKMWDFHRKYAF